MRTFLCVISLAIVFVRFCGLSKALNARMTETPQDELPEFGNFEK